MVLHVLNGKASRYQTYFDLVLSPALDSMQVA